MRAPVSALLAERNFNEFSTLQLVPFFTRDPRCERATIFSIAKFDSSVDTSNKGRQSDLVADPFRILPICSFFATFFLNRARRLAPDFSEMVCARARTSKA